MIRMHEAAGSRGGRVTGGRRRTAGTGRRRGRAWARGSLLARGSVLALVVSAALVGGPAGPAAGDPIPPVPNRPWPDAATCATGAFTEHVVTQTGPGLEPALWLSGWAQRCLDDKGEPPSATQTFGFAYFRPVVASEQDPDPVAVMRPSRFRLYDAGAAATPWAGRFDTWGTESFRTAVPICLMRDTETRMACLFVELVEDKDTDLMTFVVTPIPVDDPRVTGAQVVFVTEPSGPGPTPRCAACV